MPLSLTIISRKKMAEKIWLVISICKTCCLTDGILVEREQNGVSQDAGEHQHRESRAVADLKAEVCHLLPATFFNRRFYWRI